jgi:hypothetical protein
MEPFMKSRATSLKNYSLVQLLNLSQALSLNLSPTLSRSKILSTLQKYFKKQEKTASSKKHFPEKTLEPELPLDSSLHTLRKKLNLHPTSPFQTRPTPYIDLGLPLPDNYEEDFLELMPIDPNRLYAYWELCSPSFQLLQEKYGRLCPLVLQLKNLHSENFEVFEVAPEVQEFYFKAQSKQTYQLTLYLMNRQGQLHELLQSSSVQTPSSSPSPQKKTRMAFSPRKPPRKITQRTRYSPRNPTKKEYIPPPDPSKKPDHTDFCRAFTHTYTPF